MKVIAAMDSLKGSCSAQKAGAAVLRGVLKADPHAEVLNIPISDGGDGMLEAILCSGRGTWQPVSVTGPLGDRVEAGYAVLEEKTAVIEMSVASGITLVPKEKLNPEITTTRGTGELIRAALDHGYRDFIIGIGGSATNDGGAGMARALGVTMKNAEGKELPEGGAALKDLQLIDVTHLDARIKDCNITVAGDVKNPLCGPLGASKVYGPQKGATPEMAERLDAALFHYAQILSEQLGQDVADLPGAGAAGGLGAALFAFMQAQFRPGIEVVLDLLNFSELIEGADLVFVGEGRADGQSVFGKAPAGTAKRVKSQCEAAVVLLAGGLGAGAENLYECGIDGIFCIADGPISLEESQARTEALIERTAEAVMRTYSAAHRRLPR